MKKTTWLAAVLAAAALTACGGGGGSDGGDEGTGLVPTPPALGATLAADATTLRPLVPGAVWQYAGTTASGAGYDNTVSHAAAATGVTETGTNTYASGEASVHVVALNGSILQPDPEDVDGDGVMDLVTGKRRWEGPRDSIAGSGTGRIARLPHRTPASGCWRRSG